MDIYEWIVMVCGYVYVYSDGVDVYEWIVIVSGCVWLDSDGVWMCMSG